MAKNSASFASSSSSHAICFLSVPGFDPSDKNYPDTVQPTWIFLVTVNVIAIPPTVVLNALIIWTVFWDEQLRSCAFNILLAFLAVTDFLVGLLVEPMHCVLLGCFLGDCHSPCQFTTYALLFFAFSVTSTVTLALASIERYLAIEHPNFYLKHITGKKVMIVSMISMTGTLIYTLIGSTLMLKNYPNLVKVPLMVVIVVSAVVIFYCTFKVQLTAYRQRRTIAQQKESVQQAENQLDEQQRQLERLQEYKRVFMMTMLAGVSVLFYTPFVIQAVIQAVAGKDAIMSDFKYLSGTISSTSLHLQSLINPMIMALQLSYIRQGIKKKLACFTGN